MRDFQDGIILDQSYNVIIGSLSPKEYPAYINPTMWVHDTVYCATVHGYDLVRLKDSALISWVEKGWN